MPIRPPLLPIRQPLLQIWLSESITGNFPWSISLGTLSHSIALSPTVFFLPSSPLISLLLLCSTFHRCLMSWYSPSLWKILSLPYFLFFAGDKKSHVGDFLFFVKIGLFLFIPVFWKNASLVSLWKIWSLGFFFFFLFLFFSFTFAVGEILDEGS